MIRMGRIHKRREGIFMSKSMGERINLAFTTFVFSCFVLFCFSSNYTEPNPISSYFVSQYINKQMLESTRIDKGNKKVLTINWMGNWYMMSLVASEAEVFTRKIREKLSNEEGRSSIFYFNPHNGANSKTS